MCYEAVSSPCVFLHSCLPCVCFLSDPWHPLSLCCFLGGAGLGIELRPLRLLSDFFTAELNPQPHLPPFFSLLPAVSGLKVHEHQARPLEPSTAWHLLHTWPLLSPLVGSTELQLVFFRTEVLVLPGCAGHTDSLGLWGLGSIIPAPSHQLCNAGRGEGKGQD